MGILEKISEIEKEIARTQKNKGEEYPNRSPPPRYPLSLNISLAFCSNGVPLGFAEGQACQVQVTAFRALKVSRK